MKISIIGEYGHAQALYGMGLSHGLSDRTDLTPGEIQEKLWSRANKLAHKQGGHNKFLESIMIWATVTAPRYWWQQADTYRLSTKQSESTMHTLTKRPLTQEDFVGNWLSEQALTAINTAIQSGFLDVAKAMLPESFLQKRVWCFSYKTLQNMYHQRKNHRLGEWQDFLAQTLSQIQCPGWIVPTDKESSE